MNTQIYKNDCPAVSDYYYDKKLTQKGSIKCFSKAVLILAAAGLTVSLLLSDSVYCYVKTHVDLGLLPGQKLTAKVDTNASNDYTQAEFDEALSVMENELAGKYYLISADYYGFYPKTGSDDYTAAEGDSMAFMVNIYPDYSNSSYSRDADCPGLYEQEYQMWLVRDNENENWHVGYFGNGI